jgi:glycosyltransferase involved in cell wall biosynthesis
VRVALVTTYLSDYRLPLYRRLAASHGLEVLCYGRGGRYAPPWFADLDAQLAAADFPARRLIGGPAAALGLGRDYDAVIAPFAGGAMLPAAYAGARRFGTPFVLWASVWHQPRSAVHLATLPVIQHIYRDADAVIAYGEHVRRFVKRLRGHDDDVFIAAQAVEEMFSRPVAADEIRAFRRRFSLRDGPLVLYVGRLDETKGIDTLARAWPLVRGDAQLVVIGEGPLGPALRELEPDGGVRLLGPQPRDTLPVAYAAATACVVPSVPTPRFKEPWGLVVNEAMSQGCPVIATTAVGAAAGGLVRDTQTGLVIEPASAGALTDAIERVLASPALAETLGEAGRVEVSAYTYDAMAAGVAGAHAGPGVSPD